jgi:hypothetical protein
VRAGLYQPGAGAMVASAAGEGGVELLLVEAEGTVRAVATLDEEPQLAACNRGARTCAWTLDSHALVVSTGGKRTTRDFSGEEDFGPSSTAFV